MESKVDLLSSPQTLTRPTPNTPSVDELLNYYSFLFLCYTVVCIVLILFYWHILHLAILFILHSLY